MVLKIVKKIKMEKKQTAVEWLIEQLTPSISLQQKYIDDYENKAKEIEQKLFDSMIKSREQIMWSASQIGFANGFEYGLKNVEDYYDQLSKTQLSDEDFTREYLQKKCDEILKEVKI